MKNINLANSDFSNFVSIFYIFNWQYCFVCINELEFQIN